VPPDIPVSMDFRGFAEEFACCGSRAFGLRGKIFHDATVSTLEQQTL
jgi:hypothetical protein